jgi:hypothetical protein
MLNFDPKSNDIKNKESRKNLSSSRMSHSSISSAISRESKENNKKINNISMD